MTDDLMNPVGTDGEEISEKHFSRLCLAQYEAETIAYFSNQLAPRSWTGYRLGNPLSEVFSAWALTRPMRFQ
jgi:hypothetical protein